MTTSALIMAGGRSERMRSTAGPTHKALIPVLGVHLLERNILALLALGFHNITVATNARETDIVEYIRRRGNALALPWNAEVTCVEEHNPLGTIGVAHSFHDKCDVLVVVNVDNLSTLNLRSLVEHHLNVDAAFTIASHKTALQSGFGELLILKGQVEAYTEKPSRQISVSSGTYVIASRVLNIISKTSRTDVPSFFLHLKALGEKVSAFRHNSLWIDVNDAAAIRDAEQLVLDNPSAFEYLPVSDYSVVDLVIKLGADILIQHRGGSASRYKQQWDLPGEILPEGASGFEVAKQAALRVSTSFTADPISLAIFDDVDSTTTKIIRHHVFLLNAGAAYRRNVENVKRASIATIDAISGPTSALRRSLGYFRKCNYEQDSDFIGN